MNPEQPKRHRRPRKPKSKVKVDKPFYNYNALYLLRDANTGYNIMYRHGMSIWDFFKYNSQFTIKGVISDERD